jgi:hypothetical protein
MVADPMRWLIVARRGLDTDGGVVLPAPEALALALSEVPGGGGRAAAA